MNSKYRIKPLLMFIGKYNDNKLDREGVKNTAELMKQAVFSAPGLNIDKNAGCVIEDLNFVPASEQIDTFISDIIPNEEIALIYYCGHGFPDIEQKTVHLAFSDTTEKNALICGYDAKKLAQRIESSGIKRYILILDCCFSGYMCEMGSDVIEMLEIPNSCVYLSSTLANERGYQTMIDGKFHIPFSYWFAKSLTRHAHTYSEVSIEEIYDIVDKELKQIKEENPLYGSSCNIKSMGKLAKEKIFYIKPIDNETSLYSSNKMYFSSFFSMETLNILLVKTSIKYPIKEDDFGIPLGLWMLKSHLSTTGHQFNVDIYDERLELKKCGDDQSRREEVLSQFGKIIQQYDIIGISLSTSEVFPAIEKFRIAKQYRKITFAGGIFTSSNEEFLLSTELIDYVIPGVGTVPLSDLLSRLYKEKQEKRMGQQKLTVPGVASIASKSIDSTWIPSQLPTMRKNIWREILDKYGEFLNNRIDVYTARGCENNCLFCSLQRESRQIVHRKNDDNVIDEINFLKSEGITYFSFKDEDFLSNPTRMWQILDSVKGEGIKFKIRARYDEMIKHQISLERLRLLGVDEVQYGLESPDHVISKSINKGDHEIKNSRRQNLIDFIRSHAAHGITANCSFILGIEGEDQSYYNDLSHFIKQIYDEVSKPKVYINFLTPHPYNSQFSLKKYNLVTKNLDYFTHKFPVCFDAKANRSLRGKILSTYDNIVKHTSSELYNPLTGTIPSELNSKFLLGDECKTTDVEWFIPNMQEEISK